MPRYLVNLNPNDDERIQRLISRGLYRDLDHVIAVALRNQLLAEEEGADPWKQATSPTPGAPAVVPRARSATQPALRPSEHPIGSWTDLTTLEAPGTPATVPEPRDRDLAGTLFWAQYYKFLPLKAVARVLYRMTDGELVPLAEYSRAAVDAVTALRRVLQELDARFERRQGERLSTSFPKSEEKSKMRFWDQFLISRRPRDGLLDGFLARSKFAGIVDVDDKPYVGLTQAGVRFVEIPNPVLIETPGNTRSLGEEEVTFLVGHLREKIPAEYNHMIAFLDTVSQGATDRRGLDDGVRLYYNSTLPGAARMTPEHVSAMRAGVQSRLQEMGFIELSRDGRASTWRLTKNGAALLRVGPVLGAHSEGEGAA